MKTLYYCVLLLIAFAVSAEARTWTAKTGQTIDGEFVKLEDGTVSIQLPNKKQAKIKLDLLSDEDRQFIQNIDSPFIIEDDEDDDDIDDIQFDDSPFEDPSLITSDDSSTLSQLRKAAEQGDAEAQCQLGELYMRGEGVAKDQTEGIQWILKSAEQGYATAQLYLGICYAAGAGVPRDAAQGALWLQKAAEQGVPDAQAMLAQYYFTGTGVDQDYQEGLKWLRMAAEQGHEDAMELLRQIEEAASADDSFVELEGITEEIVVADFSPDGKKIVATAGNIVRIWDTDSGKEWRKLELEGDVVGGSPVLGRIVTQAENNAVYVWDADGKKLRTLHLGDDFFDVGVSPDGTRIAVPGDERFRLWDTETGKEIKVTPRVPSAALKASIKKTEQAMVKDGRGTWAMPPYAYFSPDGKKIVVPDLTQLAVQVYDAKTGNGLHIMEGSNPMFSPNGSKIVTGSWVDFTVAQLWNAETGIRIANIKDAEGPFIFSSDDGIFIVFEYGDEDDTAVRVFDANTGKQLRKLNLTGQPVAVSADGRRIVTENYNDKVTRVFDAADGGELQSLEGLFLDFSRDGRKIATTSSDTVRIWNMP